jgi:dihydrolipoamide dehydrogenase
VLQLNECPPKSSNSRRKLYCSLVRSFFFGYGVCGHGHRKKFQVSSPGEPEIFKLAAIKMSEHMKILTNYEAIEVRKEDNWQKTVVVKEQDSREEVKITADEILWQ